MASPLQAGAQDPDDPNTTAALYGPSGAPTPGVGTTNPAGGALSQGSSAAPSTDDSYARTLLAPYQGLLPSAGALSQAESDKRDARQKQVDSINNAMAILKASQSGINLPLAAAGAALLKPTRTGFGEAIGNAGAAAIPAYQQQRQNEMDVAKLGIEGANVAAQGAKEGYEDFLTRYQLGLKASTEAVQEDRYNKLLQGRQYAADQGLAGRQAGAAATIAAANARAGATVDAANSRAGATVQASENNAGARIGAANIGAGSRENVAGINATSRQGVADTNATSRENVAGTNAATKLATDKPWFQLTGGPTVQMFNRGTGETVDTGTPTTAEQRSEWQRNNGDKHLAIMQQNADTARQKMQQENPLILGQGAVTGNGVGAPAQGAAPVSADGSSSGADPSQVHGDDYLKALNPTIANQVRALAEGRMQFPSGFALKSPYWQQMIQAVSQYDPSFDAVNYNARSKTRADFTSGKSAQNITSFNTAIGHLGVLQDSADALDNYSTPALNTVTNWVRSATGDPRVNNFNLARNAVADELTRAFRGTGGSESEVQAWKKTLNDAQSPEQLHGAVQKGVDLLESRINAVGEQYQRGMGTTANPVSLLSSDAQKTLAKLKGGREETATPVLPESARSQLQEGHVTTFGNGQKWTLRSGIPQQVQ